MTFLFVSPFSFVGVGLFEKYFSIIVLVEKEMCVEMGYMMNFSYGKLSFCQLMELFPLEDYFDNMLNRTYRFGNGSTM